MKKITFFFAFFFTFSAFAVTDANIRKFKRQDSDHIKEIMTTWHKDKGLYLYESMAAIVTQKQQPERPEGLNKTPFELLQSMEDSRIDRLNRVAQNELENERNSTRGKRDSYYWQEWMSFLNSSRCETNQASSNGDPHITTFDGQRYDFQNAGDYVLAGSNDNSFEVQTQMFRPNSSSTISQNQAVAMNVNQDRVEFRQSKEAKNGVTIFINGEEMLVDNADYVLKNGGFIQSKTKNQYLVKWPTGEQAIVKSRGSAKNKMFDVFVTVPKCRDNYYHGMLGDNNGNKEDDLYIRNPREEERQIVSSVFTSTELFGPNRKDREVIDRQQSRGRYISHTFGDNFMLDTKTSLFSVQMVDISDEVRYPSEHLTLAQLTDEQIEEGLRLAKEAGVSEEDLYAAVYDYGHIGLTPETHHPEYSTPQRNISNPESKKDEKTIRENSNNSSSSSSNTTINRGGNTGIYIGTGRTHTPSRRPVSTRPNNRVDRPSTASPPSKRPTSTPSNRTSNPGRTPSTGGGRAK